MVKRVHEVKKFENHCVNTREFFMLTDFRATVWASGNQISEGEKRDKRTDNAVRNEFMCFEFDWQNLATIC
jgi:hypothetical protein